MKTAAKPAKRKPAKTKPAPVDAPTFAEVQDVVGRFVAANHPEMLYVTLLLENDANPGPEELKVLGDFDAKIPRPPISPVRPVARGTPAVDANRRRVLAELYESWDARGFFGTCIESFSSSVGEDIHAEDFPSARGVLQGQLLMLESLDLVRETLGRPVGDIMEKINRQSQSTKKQE